MRRGSKSMPRSTTTVVGAAEKLETLEGSWSSQRHKEVGLAGARLRCGSPASSGHFLTNHASSHGRSTKIASQNWPTWFP
ncbi:hypothetical protein ACE6H2_021688 [Prunus campanulata]